jgi:multiple sugar transport system permease protein
VNRTQVVPPTGSVDGIARASRRLTVRRWVESATDAAGIWLLIVPGLVLLVIFVVIPFVFAIGLSFTNQRLVSPIPTRLVGWDNYVRVIADPVFRQALFNNVEFAVIVPLAQTAFGLLLAVLVNQPIRGAKVFLAIYFAPVVFALAVAATIWKLMYNTDSGLVDSFLGYVTAGRVHVDWLGNPSTAFPAIMIMSIWQGVGFQMVILLAGLQEISAELYEAAKVDGANRWQRFRYVTLPGVRKTAIFALTVSMILSFRLFDQVFVMTRGGPLQSTVTMVYQMSQVGYQEERIGQGSAIAVIFFVIVLALTLVFRRIAPEEGG